MASEAEVKLLKAGKKFKEGEIDEEKYKTSIKRSKLAERSSAAKRISTDTEASTGMGARIIVALVIAAIIATIVIYALV
jgi:hypothetical protein